MATMSLVLQCVNTMNNVAACMIISQCVSHLLQVMIYGGIRRADTVELFTELYALDFSATTPRWRKATVGNMIVKGAYQMDFPNTGIASLPTIGAVVLMNRQVGMICYGAFAERCSLKSRKMHALEIPRSRFI